MMMAETKNMAAFAWDGHCVYGDNDSIKAVHTAVRLAADPVMSLVRVWLKCPPEKRPSAWALVEGIKATVENNEIGSLI
jgi:hypothetical protein